ncbi:hypothetical protein ACOMHN_054310 [Nucella lapillus]
MMAEISRQDLQDLSRAEQDKDDENAASRPLSNPVPASLLLRIFRAEAALQKQQEEPQRTPNDVEKDENNEINNDNKIKKRVFCNAFTGCGGRHRQINRRRRLYGKRLIPVLVKRPFCTSFGCFNTQSSSPAKFSRARLLRGLPGRQRVKERRGRKVGGGDGGGGGAGVGKGKRLFCNGFWGCRNAKRSLFSPWMSKMSSVADNMR